MAFGKWLDFHLGRRLCCRPFVRWASASRRINPWDCYLERVDLRDVGLAGYDCRHGYRRHCSFIRWRIGIGQPDQERRDDCTVARAGAKSLSALGIITLRTIVASNRTNRARRSATAKRAATTIWKIERPRTKGPGIVRRTYGYAKQGWTWPGYPRAGQGGQY